MAKMSQSALKSSLRPSGNKKKFSGGDPPNPPFERGNIPPSCYPPPPPLRAFGTRKTTLIREVCYFPQFQKIIKISSPVDAEDH